MAQRTSAPKTLTEEARLAKNKRIKEAGKATRERRKTMIVKVYDLKIVQSSMNKQQKEAIKSIFHEAKWIRNAALAAERFDLDYIKELKGEVEVKVPNGDTEKRAIKHLGSQMQQSVITQLSNDRKSLSALKKNGRKIGKLKFVRNVDSINLKQYGVTYDLIPNSKGMMTKIRVQNIPGRLRVRGYEQLCADSLEFANAKLVYRADGYHLVVTTYQPRAVKVAPTNKIGVDMGVKNALTLDNGEVVNAIITGKQERMARLQRKLSRQVKNSNSYRKTLAKIKREYQNTDHLKNEFANQLVSRLTKDSVVFFQDEMLVSWKNKNSKARGSKKIHHGVLGRVKARLKNHENAVMLPKWVATTAWCSSCGVLTKHDVNMSVFLCSSCGFSEDRDSHAARNMVILGERYLSLVTSGTEGCAGGGIVRLKNDLYKV